MANIYDFRNWEIGGDEEKVLADIVRSNLRQAFSDFGAGRWNCYGGEVYWHPGGTLSDCDLPPCEITITGEQFFEVMFYAMELRYPNDGKGPPYSQSQKDDLAEWHERILTPWRDAVRKIDDAVAKLLAMEIAEPPPRKPPERLEPAPVSWRTVSETPPPPPPATFATYNHETKEATLDWPQIEKVAEADDWPGQPFARMLLLARDTGRSSAGFVA
jgi:hypothetical protein